MNAYQTQSIGDDRRIMSHLIGKLLKHTVQILAGFLARAAEIF